MSPRSRVVAVTIETGTKRVFASALEWPGWSRSAKDERGALEALTHYRERYAPVATAAGLVLPPDAADRFDVVDRLAGNATTDFGAPAAIREADAEPMTRAGAERVVSLVQACWAALDAAAASAPADLRKGPRGGGRDRDAIVEHVIAAEAAYARKLAVRVKTPRPGDRSAQSALRNQIVAVLLDGPVDGVVAAWPARYGARRIAWHALDHAWEIEDRRAR